MSNRTDSPQRQTAVHPAVYKSIYSLKLVTMEKRKKTVFVSFASQKGGVGKSTFAIYAAS